MALRAGFVFRLATIFILARVIAPSEFGVIAVALATTDFIEYVTQANFDVALVQRKGRIERFLNTTWTLQVIRGIVLGVITVAIAPLIAAFFAVPEVERVLQVLAVAFVLRGFANIGVVYFQKDMEMQKRFIVQMSRILTSSLVSLILALMLQSVWALVWGVIAGRAAMLVVSYLAHPYRPRLGWDWSQVKELWSFSRWIFASLMVTYAAQYVDRLFIGKMLGPVSLGFYQLAFRLSHFFADQAKFIGGDVTFPLYAKLQDEQERLRGTFLWSTQISVLIALPVAAGLIIIGSTIVPVVLGPQWIPMVPTMQIMAVAALYATLEGVGFTQLLRAVGRPDLTTKLMLLRVALVVATIYPLASNYGLVGAALSAVFASLITLLVSLKLVLRIIDCSRFTYLKALFVPGISTAGMALVLIVADTRIAGDPSIVSLIFMVGIGAVTYVAGVAVFDWMSGRHITRLVQNYLTPMFRTRGKILSER